MFKTKVAEEIKTHILFEFDVILTVHRR